MNIVVGIFAAIALLYMLGRPMLVILRWIRDALDTYGSASLELETRVHAWQAEPLVAHFGPHDFLISGTVYYAKFFILDQEFVEEVPEMLYGKCMDIKVLYRIGKSGKVYIKKVLDIESCS